MNKWEIYSLKIKIHLKKEMLNILIITFWSYHIDNIIFVYRRLVLEVWDSCKGNHLFNI